MKPGNISVVFIFACLLFLQAGTATAREEADADLRTRLERIEQLLASDALLEMLQQIQALQEDIQRLQGAIEVQNHTLDQLRKRQRDLYTDIDQRMQRLEGGSPVTAPGGNSTLAGQVEEPPLETLSPVTDTASSADSTGSGLTVEVVGAAPATTAEQTAATAGNGSNEDIIAPVTASDPIQARADYQQAFKLLKQSLYDQSIKAFQEFLAVHPVSEFSDNAQYWLAEAHFVKGQYSEALQEYSNLVANYPNSQKLTQAKLKIGYSLQELGQIAGARQALEKLVTEHPGTTAARLAQNRLKEIAAIPAQPAAEPADAS